MSDRPRYDDLAAWYDQEIRRLDITTTVLDSLPGDDDYPILFSYVAER